MGRVFGSGLEVVRWDAPLTHLPTREAVRDYLVARFVPRTAAEEAAATVETPLDLTKCGALVVARKLS